MQLKIITGNGTFRFNQRGEQITALTEPYVKVEVDNKEDVEALYDALCEHLSLAFTYGSGDSITGLSPQAQDSIQNFLLVENAWYLRDLEDPSTDVPFAEKIKSPPPVHRPVASPVEAETVEETPVFSGFIPDQTQRGILKDIQETAERLRRITPDPADKWNVQLQRQLNAVLFFGVDNVTQACEAGQAKLKDLRQAALKAGIPEGTIDINVTPQTADVEEEDEM